jgi:carbamoyltransferase|tara:strand:+ start:240 stop:1196 length:957 start_codon:yes stop_codon:yes gene_type:complete
VTVGVNISHDSSICIKKEKSIEFFEESRFSKNKYWEPTQGYFDYLSFNKIKKFDDIFVFSSYGRNNNDDEKIINNICKKYKIQNFIFNSFMHHIYHAFAGFYLSPFEEAFCIVIDGGGARFPNKQTFQETDSIYYMNKSSFDTKYKSYSNARSSTLWSTFYDKDKLIKLTESVNYKDVLNNFYFTEEGVEYRMTHSYNPGLLFNHLCATIRLSSNNGFKAEAGKAMGLSSYGNNFGKRDEDLAKQVQEATEKYTIELIEKALSYGNIKNIVLSGGYALNCVNNYKYTQYFKNVNFFIDPCAHDGGTSLGAALWYDNYR